MTTRPESGSPVGEPDTSGFAGKAMGQGFAWSLLNNFVGKLGSFLAGIVVVRLLAEDEFGTYAVGMVVLAVLLSMNELGVSVAVVQRKGRVDDIAPTVVTVSIVSSVLLAGVAFLAAPFVAGAMNAPDATWLIRLLLVGVVIDGVVAVPNALITRALQQRKRLVIDTTALLIGTPVTIGLALAGAGAWSLGWGAVVGNVITGVLAYAWAPARYAPGWRRDVLPELLRFGLPLAGSSLLLLLMLNVDYVVVGHLLGPTQLGLYLLAFNVASWPTTVIGSALRRVTLTSFARISEQDSVAGNDAFARICGLVMAVTIPVCALLSCYAGPVIEILYGARWMPAAAALQLLVVLSAGRLAVELTYDFLAATGRTVLTVWLHGVWLVALVPVLVVGATAAGITGVAAAQALVVLVVVAPLLAIMLRGTGVGLRSLLRHNVLPLVGVVPIVAAALVVLQSDWSPVAQVLVGGAVGGTAYLAVVSPMRRSALLLWRLSG